ncbi:MAG: metallophosphoesterase [Solobacterium sp.]|nr:metallophosphoesterase [Solobacterium sp.]
MKVLIVADREEPGLWDYFNPRRTEGVQLILSCGDLDPAYLEFLTTMVNAPLLFVRGNHDGKYDVKYPEGCIDIDDKVYTHNGIRFFGLGGSYRYKPGSDMYTEREMKRRIGKARGKLFFAKGFDVLVTHAPACGYGDLEDLPHRGFECFNDLLEKHHPAYMFHGHVHEEYGDFVRERKHPCGTRIINACGQVIMDLEI